MDKDKMFFLDGYRRAVVRERAIREEILTLRDRQASAKAISYNSMPRGTELHDMSDYIVSVEEKVQKLLSQMRKTDDVLQFWVSVIKPQIKDKKEYLLIYNRHIKGMKPKQAAIQAGYETMQKSRSPYARVVRDIYVSEEDIYKMAEMVLDFE